MKNFVKSVYFKTAATFLASGAILILFLNWVRATNFAKAIATINSTLMPIYIGCAIAFIMCPIYNDLVNFGYRYLSGDVVVGMGKSFVSNESRHARLKTLKGRRRILMIARIFASVVCVLIMFGLIFLFAYFVLPQIVDNVVNLINTMPKRLAALSEWSSIHLARFPQIQQWINSLANNGMKMLVDWIQNHILKSSDGGTSIAQMISNGVLSVISTFADVFVGLLLSIYLLNYKERLFAICRKLMNSLISERKAKDLYEIGHTLNETLIKFLAGRILDALVIGMITYVALLIAHINLPLLISVIVGVTNIIPVFGPFIGAIPSFLLILTDNPTKALWFLVIIVVIQQLDGNVIGPKIVGNAIGLSSFWVLIAVLIGGGFFGVLGMLLGTPIFAVIYKYVDMGARKRLTRKQQPVDTDDYYQLKSYGISRDEIFDEEFDSDERMNLITRLNDMGISGDRVLQDEPMNRHTTFRIGGPADLFVTVNTEAELAAVLRLMAETGTRHLLIGNGSNLLVADEGYDGVIIRLGGSFQDVEVTGELLSCGAACLLSHAAQEALSHGLSGMEFASGIPGSVGGALFMNAGAYGGEMKDICVRVRVMSPDGSVIRERNADDLRFTYRNSALQQTGEIVLRADFALTPGDQEEIAARMKELNEKRTEKQPLNYPSAGSTFKRPSKGYAAQLIDEAGLKGLAVGGAMVSPKHAGFVINTGNATAEDVLALMQTVSDKVYENAGVRLEPEIRIIRRAGDKD